ncbi:hypothetical protein [Peribacillus loiseleuriae]|uniref:Uncharacterized protein n=1 Tax=Peribacillus loiseleuriae TaxID=1679170 RepID=A0A0K9GSJ4_9BACI|nr:hypothetical protein [Peribacillus loiseleuriae]KMY49247.1 hypothetical protein AC625_06695 [Peribacillus loiseleuriae]
MADIIARGMAKKIDDKVEETNRQLAETNRRDQVLTQGLQVLQSDQNAPLDVRVEGCTRVPMHNTVLSPGSYYVLADKRTKLKWADATITTGVAKFTAKAERPTIIRVANFESKISGSAVENPHIAKRGQGSALLTPSSGAFVEEITGSNGYADIQSLNGITRAMSAGIKDNIAQQLFSFDIIQEIERQIGRIPRLTITYKVQWLKDNIAKLSANWHGFGSSVGGNKATVAMWSNDAMKWYGNISSSSPNITKITRPVSTQADINVVISVDGFVHFLAYAEPAGESSPGMVVPSTISTDMVELEIELKPEAILHDPRVPLFEVDKSEYDKLLVNYDENTVLSRYPRVEGTKHLQGVYVMAEGANLFPAFYEADIISASASVKAPYEVEFTNPSANQEIKFMKLPTIKNQVYTFKVNSISNGAVRIYVRDKNGIEITKIILTGEQFVTFTATSEITEVTFRAVDSGIKCTFKDPMLTLGSTAKPHVPRNPSYLFANVKLGQIGDKKDILMYDNGDWKVRRETTLDVILDGSLPWAFSANKTGFKAFAFTNPTNIIASSNQFKLSKYNGSVLNGLIGDTTSSDNSYTGASSLVITVSNTDTGFTESVAPTSDEIKAYFNGWQVKTVDANGKPTAWKSIVDGSDAPTQTLAYVKTNMAPNYTPYKLSYVLATPVTEVVNHLVEGDIAVNGLTQIEVGSGVIVREKVTPVINGVNYLLNYISMPTTHFKNTPLRIVGLYKNGQRDTKWLIGVDSSYKNNIRIYIPQADFDPASEYTVTYIALDKEKLTTNSVSVPVSWAGSLPSAVKDIANKQSDIATTVSVYSKLIYDMLVRMKAGGI